MYRYFVFLAVVLVSCNSATHKKHKQDSIPVAKPQNHAVFPFTVEKFNWASIEKSNDSLKNAFINANLAKFTDEYGAYKSEYNTDKLIDALHICDINGDGKDDLIFEGKSGGEPYEVAFILHTTNGFNIVFKSFQFLRKLDIKAGKVFRAYIKDDGCCAAYIDFNKTYTATYKGDIPHLKLETVSANYHNMPFNGSYFKSPIRFAVLNENYKLRFEPIVNDTTKNGIDGEIHKGNTVAELHKNTTGTALASSTDKSGRVWWLVQIPAKYKLGKSLFYEDPENGITADKVGWISSRYVKTID